MFEPTIAPIRERLLRAGVVSLGVFGSFARGDAVEGSDVDVLVDFRPDAKTLDNVIEVGDALESVFKRRIDLVTRDALSPYIGPHILRAARYVDLGRRVSEPHPR